MCDPFIQRDLKGNATAYFGWLHKHWKLVRSSSFGVKNAPNIFIQKHHNRYISATFSQEKNIFFMTSPFANYKILSLLGNKKRNDNKNHPWQLTSQLSQVAYDLCPPTIPHCAGGGAFLRMAAYETSLHNSLVITGSKTMACCSQHNFRQPPHCCPCNARAQAAVDNNFSFIHSFPFLKLPCHQHWGEASGQVEFWALRTESGTNNTNGDDMSYWIG